MWKHIILQAFFEIGLLLFLYMKAPYFIKEDKLNILKSHEELNICFDTLPGNMDYNKYKNSKRHISKNPWRIICFHIIPLIIDSFFFVGLFNKRES